MNPLANLPCDDGALRHLYADIVFDSLLAKIRGRKLRKVIRLLRRIGFDREATVANHLGVKVRSVQMALYRFRRQAAELAENDPALRQLYEQFFGS